MAATRSGPTERTRSERAAAIRRQHGREEARRRNLWVTLGVLAVLGIVVAAGFLVQVSRDTTGQASAPPAGAVATYGVPFGEDTAPVTVTIYEDFMCPVCGDLESATRDWLPRYAAQGRVRVIYRPVAFLDRMSNGTEYSTRAANAYAVVLDEAGPEAAATFHDLLFDDQPEENTSGLSSDHLLDLAIRAGAAESVARAGIERRTYEQWVVNGTDDASRRGGVTGTPTVAVDGRRLPTLPPFELAPRLRQSVDSALHDSEE
jgi:protein-disulfide isomerase